MTVAALGACKFGQPDEQPKALRQAEPDSYTLVRALMRQIDIPGPASDQAIRDMAQQLFTHRDAMGVLTAEYRALPSTASHAGWKLIMIAGKANRPDAVEFLTGIAAAPMPRASIVLRTSAHGRSSASSDDQGADEYINRLAAAYGVVKSLAAGTAGSDAALQQLMQESERGIVESIGVELFTRNMLSESFRQSLQARGVNTDFQRMSQQEWNAQFTVRPDLAHLAHNFTTAPAKP